MEKKKNLPVVVGWMRRQPMKVKVLVVVGLMAACLLALKLTVKNHSHFFVASELSHAAGLLVLGYKLIRQRTCSGLSLKTQELTAIFLVARFISSTITEQNIHTVLDFITLASTTWVIYMMRVKLKASYAKDLDNFPIYYVVAPCIVLAVLIHPYIPKTRYIEIIFAFCVYAEALSVLPQLRLMQNMKMIEPFTAHYVFALGVARFMAWAHWIIQTIDTRGAYFYMIGSGSFWFLAIFLAEIVQSFILVDFCYYYIKSFMEGQMVMTMPV
ncbi:ER lumen protein-retaining receptor erd-2.2-like [Rhodamnia argentea]|uniref:ER lumen protein-retaining receptor erd-2.2-like n=1 Tax=Rhodamnia argentea TaxID=178133 RepID=A0A8B8QNI2_9MYRT|nr:ER lumen protein-retaining receptor erd-2.2-like [Rhodamnia argentea]